MDISNWCYYYTKMSLFSFLSVIYGCHCTDCGMFQCIFSFCMPFLVFLCWGVGFTHERVIIVSLCNNIHFSVTVTFYFDSQSPSVVLFFLCGFCLSICLKCCENSLGFTITLFDSWCFSYTCDTQKASNTTHS